MILYIAEKPSLGRAIADALPKPHKKGEGYIQLGNGDYVSWCIGHLLEQAEPDAYDPSYKSWRFEHLPIIPQQWQLKPKTKTRSQLTVLRKLVKQADQLVNAGDPDREGQLLVDQVIAHLGVKGAKLKQVQRLLVSDLNIKAVKRALNQMRSNQEFIPLSTSALARSRADWLYGMNMTRAYTLQGKKVGYQGVLSVGRVQTPVLGLVVRRDQDIAQFQPKPFYEVIAHIAGDDAQSFRVKWCPSEACLPFQDEDGRVLSKGLAMNVATRITQQPATVTDVTSEQKKQAAPLPYSLSSLQIDAAKRFNMSAKQVLDTCQTLYEKYKLITYPRSDSRYLPTEQFSLASSVIAAITSGCPELIVNCDNPNAGLKSRAWNNSKVDAHHAIIPTEKPAVLTSLSQAERQIYQQVARQYLAQFYPHYCYSESNVALSIEGGRFTTKAKQETSLGWKQLFAATRNSNGQADGQSELSEPVSALLPPLKVGQILNCAKGEVADKMTQAPKHFNDATLLSAMTGIARFVVNKDIKKTLKDTDGLGTEATRAGIIELLFKRGYIQRTGKSILATEIGAGLIQSLPESATTPDMTALWEQHLDAMAHKKATYQSFMQPLQGRLVELVAQAEQQSPDALAGLKGPNSQPFRKKRSRRSGHGGSRKSK